ncbi:MAG: putative ferredoxin 2Fe-2S protein [Francisellaceae bacterium]|nr:putative ferredoxin 2Fe-2S protein [Francisellaceae bacterium]
MSYYQYHVFFCQNERAAGKECCMKKNAQTFFDYMKAKIKELKLNGKGQVRINRAGCLDRCSQGPILVVYPEGIWYQCLNTIDIDEIIHSHFINGKHVERLKL